MHFPSKLGRTGLLGRDRPSPLCRSQFSGQHSPGPLAGAGSLGAFSLAYAIFLLLGTVHTGLWTEPMLVYGSGRYRENFPAYQQILLRHHWRFGGATCLFFLVLHLGFWACGAREIALSFLGLSLAAPTVLYLWLVRRGAYVLLKSHIQKIIDHAE